MNKTILSIAVAFIGTANLISIEKSDLPLKILSLYESEWHLVQDILITQARMQTDTVKQNALRLMASAGLGLTSQFLLNGINLFLYKRSEKAKFDATRALLYAPRGQAQPSITELSKDFFYSTSILSPALTVASLIFIRKKALRAAELKQVEKVIQAWPELRPQFPEKLRTLFDTLYALSKKESDATEYRTLVPDAARLTKEAVANHFNEHAWYSFIHTLFNTVVN